MAGIGPRQEDPSVSRISRTRESTHVIALKVEGALVADWVPVLEGVCAGPLAERKEVELDFEDVSFLDREAATAVRELIARGVTILRPTPLVRHLLNRQDPL
jgi:hypothetical protein